MFTRTQGNGEYTGGTGYSRGGPSLTGQLRSSTDKEAAEKSALDKLPSLPHVLECDREKTKDEGVLPPLCTTKTRKSATDQTDTELVRSSMYVVPGDEDLFELIGMPLLVVFQPFNSTVVVPEYKVRSIAKCKECKSYPTVSTAVHAYKCVICGVENEVQGDCPSLRESTLDYVYSTEESSAQMQDGAESTKDRRNEQRRHWYASDALPRIEKIALPSCRKWREPCVMFVVDSSLSSKKTHAYREYVRGMRSIIGSGSFSLLYKRFAVVLAGREPAVIGETEMGYTIHLIHSTEGARMCSPLFIETESMTEQKAEELIQLIDGYSTDRCEMHASVVVAIQLVSYTGGGKVLCLIASQEQKIEDEEKTAQAAVDCGISVHMFAEGGVGLERVCKLALTTGGSIEREDIYEMMQDRVGKETYYRCAVRVVCSNGVRKRAIYSSGFAENISNVLIPEMTSTTAFCVSFTVDDFIKDCAPVHIQASIEYIDVCGEKKVRILNTKLKASRLVQQIFVGLSFDTLFCGMCKYICAEPANMIQNIYNAESVIVCALSVYKKICAKETSASQLVLPDPIKVLPVLIQSILKYPKIHIGPQSRIEVAGEIMGLSVERTLRMFYPRLVKISSLFAVPGIEYVSGERLSMQFLCTDEGYILDNGTKAICWFGQDARDVMQEMLESDVVAQAVNKLKETYNTHIKVRECIQGEKDADFIGYMVEDQMGGYPKYQEYLALLHNKIAKK